MVLKKKYWFIVGILLILLAIGVGYFINRIHFYGEIKIQINTKDKDSNFQLFAYSPTGRAVDFYKENDSTYFIKGYYHSLNIRESKKEFSSNLESASISINGKIIHIGKIEFYTYWENRQLNATDSYYSLKPDIVSTNWFYKFYALVFYTFPIYQLCFIFLAFLFAVYYFFEKNLSILFHKLAPITEKKIILICLVLLLIYTAIFSNITRLDDKIKISGDYPVYQILAVNLIKGPASGSQSFYDKYKFDEVVTDSVEYNVAIHNYEYSYATLSAWVPPVYPLFLGVIYKIFGVSPYAARYIQLLLLLIVAAFIPLLMFYYFKVPGFVLGIIGGLIFIINIYPTANELMTEPLTIFLCFLLLFSIKYFELKMSKFSAVLLGLALTTSLLVKGVVVFMIIFYFAVLVYRHFKLKNKVYSKKMMIVFTAFLVSFLPWIIYTNLNEGIIQKSNLSKKEIQEDNLKMKNILAIVEKQKTSNQFDSTLKALNKKKFHAPQFSIFINRSCNIISDTHLSNLQKKDFFIATSRQIITRLDNMLQAPCFKLNDKNYIYFNKPIFISTNHTYEIYESNNKNCIDGDIHPDKFIKETYDAHPNYPSFIRVLNFYFENPRYIFIIFPNKIFGAFHKFPFVSLLISLIISNFIMLLMAKWKLEKNKFFKATMFLIIPLIMFCANYNVVGFNICFSFAIFAIFLSLIKKKALFLFQLPLSFNLIILNFLFITLIFFGNSRITAIVDFVFITVSIVCFFHYYGQLTNKTVFKNA